jgi:hypothetical protein
MPVHIYIRLFVLSMIPGSKYVWYVLPVVQYDTLCWVKGERFTNASHESPFTFEYPTMKQAAFSVLGVLSFAASHRVRGNVGMLLVTNAFISPVALI